MSDTTSPTGATHDAHRARQERLLERLLALLVADPRVLGVIAGGSYARGANDAFSDLDLHCYLRDEERTGREEIHRAVAALGPTLSVLYTYDRNGLYLYDDGVRLDLDYLPPSAIATRVQGGTTILLDPDGVLARDLGSVHRHEHRVHPRWWEPGDPAYVTWFLWMFRQVYAWTKRGAQGGDRALAKLTSAADSIHQTRTSLTELRLWTLDQPYNLAAADPALAEALARTYPHLVPDELLGATRALLAAYERVCPDYCAKAGVAYPVEKVVALHRVLDELDRLS
jgi:predicted nucleotidyltransferase